MRRCWSTSRAAKRATAPPAGSEDALAALAQAVADKPDDDNARFDFIKALLLLGRTDDAKVAFAPVIAKASMSRIEMRDPAKRYNPLSAAQAKGVEGPETPSKLGADYDTDWARRAPANAARSVA